MSLVRVRQHVNPLSQKYQVVTPPPNWQQVYSNLSLPLHLDIGCARGRFLLGMATEQPDWNYLGLEIREALVVQAEEKRQELGLKNLHYLFCNANTSLKPLLASLPTGCLQRVTIQFPDPWFKNRHAKRRVVQPEMVEAIAEYLVAGGIVFLQSDVQVVEEEMCDRFAEHSAFSRTQNDWLESNPLQVPTEREQLVLSEGKPVYRAIFIKK